MIDQGLTAQDQAFLQAQAVDLVPRHVTLADFRRMSAIEQLNLAVEASGEEVRRRIAERDEARAELQRLRDGLATLPRKRIPHRGHSGPETGWIHEADVAALLEPKA